MNVTHVLSSAPSIVVVQSAYRFTFPGIDDPVDVDSRETWESPYRLVAAPQDVLPTEPPVEDWLKFQRLVNEWRVERGAMASVMEAALCPAYQSVIGMGPSVVPFILAELELEGEDPDHWFWALKAVTGADPVREEDRGNLRAMSRAWRDWWAQSQANAW